ncbi:sugar ABC transporter permease [Phaeacidiphilus oryzae]|uniref:sugar ABC transporter permease n=1 Tax=Phaeacidiphilus oryzae TaxID=348818 RepID=UPI00056286DB|nr:carbohydrate ABC transporter permease [Phaeacidiphilus oryzae]
MTISSAASAIETAPAQPSAGAARGARATGRPRPRGERGPLASLLLHGGLVLAAAVAVFPVAWVLLISLGPKNAWQDPGLILGHLGFGNYRALLTGGGHEFLHWMGSSLLVAVATTVVGLLLSASAGYAVSRMRFPGHRPLMWMFLVTQMFPAAVLIVPLYNILAALNLLDTYQGLVLVYCTVSVPFSAWMLKGYFDTVPVEIDEAGRVDGLTPFGTFWRLVLPLSRPGIAVAAFYGFLTAWGEFAYANLFMSSDKYTLPVGIQTFATAERADWNLVTPAAMIILIPAAVVFFLIQRHLASGLTAGSTKG